MPGEGSNRGLRHRDVTGVPSNPAIGHLTVQEAQARPQDPQKCPLQHSAAPQATQRPRNPAWDDWPRCFQSSSTRKMIFFWRGREAPHTPQLLLLVLDLVAFCQGRDGLGWGSKDKVPSMVPHLVFLPRILLPFTWYSWSLPTTANGIISWGERKTRSCFLPGNWPGNQTSEQSPTLSCFQEGFMG